MRYTVTGEHLTSREVVTIEIDAVNEDDARRVAGNKQIAVQSVNAAGPPVVEYMRSRPKPAVPKVPANLGWKDLLLTGDTAPLSSETETVDTVLPTRSSVGSTIAKVFAGIALLAGAILFVAGVAGTVIAEASIANSPMESLLLQERVTSGWHQAATGMIAAVVCVLLLIYSKISTLISLVRGMITR